MSWAGRYVGVPFVDGGRDMRGADCWGLVRLVLARECDIEVPSYGEISAGDLAAVAGMVARKSVVEPWVPAEGEHRAFDVVVMRRHRAPVHVGIMADARLLLHVEKTSDAVLVPLTYPSVAQRKKMFFRHRELA